MGHTARTEPQCLHKGALYFFACLCIWFSFLDSHIARCSSMHYVCFRSHQLQLTHVQYACVVWVQKMIWKPTCYGHILVMASTGRLSSKSWLKTNGEIFVISIKHILSALWSKWQVYPYISFIAPFVRTQKYRIYGKLTSMLCSYYVLKFWAVVVIRQMNIFKKYFQPTVLRQSVWCH